MGDSQVPKYKVKIYPEIKAENMIKVPGNDQEGGQGQVWAKAVLALFRSSFPKKEST